MKLDSPQPPNDARAVRCLSCARTDRLVRVPVLFQQRAIHEVRGRVPGPYGYSVPVRARAVRTSPLEAALAPPRRRRLSKVPLAVAAILGMCGALNLVAAAASGSLGGFVGAAVICALAAGAILRIVRRHRAAPSSGVVVGRALWLWRRCWYCGRCGVVSLHTPNVSTMLPAATLATALVGLASRLVWRARTAPSATIEPAASKVVMPVGGCRRTTRS
jgi:hypothetical protein